MFENVINFNGIGFSSQEETRVPRPIYEAAKRIPNHFSSVSEVSNNEEEEEKRKNKRKNEEFISQIFELPRNNLVLFRGSNLWKDRDGQHFQMVDENDHIPPFDAITINDLTSALHLEGRSIRSVTKEEKINDLDNVISLGGHSINDVQAKIREKVLLNSQFRYKLMKIDEINRMYSDEQIQNRNNLQKHNITRKFTDKSGRVFERKVSVDFRLVKRKKNENEIQIVGPIVDEQKGVLKKDVVLIRGFGRFFENDPELPNNRIISIVDGHGGATSILEMLSDGNLKGYIKDINNETFSLDGFEVAFHVGVDHTELGERYYNPQLDEIIDINSIG